MSQTLTDKPTFSYRFTAKWYECHSAEGGWISYEEISRWYKDTEDEEEAKKEFATKVGKPYFQEGAMTITKEVEGTQVINGITYTLKEKPREGEHVAKKAKQEEKVEERKDTVTLLFKGPVKTCRYCESLVGVPEKSHTKIISEESGYRGIVNTREQWGWICPNCKRDNVINPS